MEKKSGLGTAGFVLGIIAICTSFIPIINNLSFVMGILAVIFGIITLVKKANKWKAIISIILGILSIIITINFQQSFSKSIDKTFDEVNNKMDEMSGNSTEEILAKYVDVSLGEFQVEKGQYVTDTKLVVNVKNKTNETKTFSIQVEAVDSNGTRIDQSYVYADKLGAGQNQDFEIFTLISSEKIESLKKATFKIVEVSMY